MKSIKNEIIEFIYERYGNRPEYLWKTSDTTAAIRHSNNKKWYAAIMVVPKSKFNIDSDEPVDLINLKCDPLLMGSLIREMGIFPAFHMNKEKWISVFLDGSVDAERVKFLIALSYDLTDIKLSKKKVPQDADR